MEKVKTKTKEFESDYAIASANSGQAYIRILNASADTLRKVFGDKTETSVIWIGDRALKGYTRLVAVLPATNAFKVVMEKE